jgi:hypothetical protein
VVKIRAQMNGKTYDVPESRARELVRRGIFEFVDAPLDLDTKSRAELLELAAGLDVRGTGKSGYVTRADLVGALSGTYRRRDMRAEV